jgi:O-antigen/teichoic acid export membrane protein
MKPPDDGSATLTDSTRAPAQLEPSSSVPVGSRSEAGDTVTADPPPLIARRTGVFVLFAVALANAANYGFHIVAGRFLGAEAYGLLAGLMAFIGVIAVATGSMQSVAAKAVASGRLSSEPSSFDRLSRSSTQAGLLATGVLVALSPVIAGFLRTGVLPVIFMAAFVTPAMLASIAIGRMQGALRYAWMAVLSAGLAISKFLSGTVVLAAGLGVTSMIASLVIATAVIGATGLRASNQVGSISAGIIDRDTARVLLGTVLFWLLMSVDVPFARNSFSDEVAGQYAAAAVVARTVLWLPAVVVQIAFPRLSEAVSRNQRTGKLLARSLGLTLLIAAAGVLTISLFGSAVIRIAFGAEYLPAADYAWMLALATLPLAVINMLLFHHLARSRWRFAVVIAVSLTIEVVGLAALHDSPEQFALVLGAAGCIGVIGLIPTGGWELLRIGRRRPAESTEPR